MDVVTSVALAGLGLAALLCVARLVQAGSLADRIIALDTILVIVICSVAVHAARTRSGTYLDLVVVAALLGFVGTVTVARFIERRGA